MHNAASHKSPLSWITPSLLNNTQVDAGRGGFCGGLCAWARIGGARRGSLCLTTSERQGQQEPLAPKKSLDSACRHTLGGPREDFCTSRICRDYQVRFKSLFATLIAVVLRIGEAGEAAAAASPGWHILSLRSFRIWWIWVDVPSHRCLIGCNLAYLGHNQCKLSDKCIAVNSSGSSGGKAWENKSAFPMVHVWGRVECLSGWSTELVILKKVEGFNPKKGQFINYYHCACCRNVWVTRDVHVGFNLKLELPQINNIRLLF